MTPESVQAPARAGTSSAVSAIGAATTGADMKDFVAFRVADQRFGIPLPAARDVLARGSISPIPLAPPAVRGGINLRGRIVTAIDMRVRFGLAPSDRALTYGLTVELGDELCALLVDAVDDVVSAAAEAFEPNPPTMDARWRALADGVIRLAAGPMVVLDLARLLDLGRDPVSGP